MVLKRKRSASELCSSPSASSTCSSTFSFSSPPNNISAPVFWDNSNVSRNLFNAPTHLNSRTMKRFRDGRPSEELVHQRTLNLLFSAQQHQTQEPESQHIESHDPLPQASNTVNTQHSLHRFWAISSAPKPPTTSIATPVTSTTGCEDCGANLDSGMMDVDESGLAALACGACGKHVCFSCSVSNLGEQKRCLQCAGKAGGWDDGAMQM
ncbi:hypothetical protein LIA77_06085 [Sarocladium implicatum]|nr:hypothetical protein LIA77_06085 [Sarocladium implicatum]